MTLTAGRKLGPYEVLAQIGAGGMGEVYRAKDARLNREVAIKILPAQFSNDSDRMRRFEQEAKATGMLNHPNIVSVYDIGSEDGTVYVVSELLSGETLRERLGGAALPVRKAIDYGLQIAHGLAAAHEKGIVHRDLKPENIFLTKDGRAKILDFGLAKLTEIKPLSTGVHSKMLTVDPGTQPGVVLGTVGYMSPEQVRGREIDHRSDIFSFGAIFYEMLTGKRAFHRDSTADTMSAILKEDPPDFSSMNQNVPPSLERVIRHCLEKNPEERFQSARDLAFDLEMVSSTSGTAPISVRETASNKTVRRALATLLIVAGLAAAFWAGRHSVPKPAIASSSQLSEVTFRRLTFRRGFVSAARFSPDGQSIVYSASWVGAPEELFMTRPQSPVSRPLGLTDASLLSISSTGEMAILLHPTFTSGWQRIGTLARVPIDGAAPREILNDVQDADWTPDGKDLAVVHVVKGRFRIEYPIGKPLYETEGWVNNLHISPNNDLIAFMEHPAGGDDRGTVAIIDLNGKKKILTQEFASGAGLHWTSNGKEIWFTASQEGSNEQPIYAVDLDGNRRVVSAMVGNLILHDIDPKGVVLLTRDSRRREIVALPPGEIRERDLSWFDWSFARYLTPDGKTMVFEEQGAGGGPNYSVFIRKTDGSPAVKLGEGVASAMSPDGEWVGSKLPSDVGPDYTLLPTGAGQSKVIHTKQVVSVTGQVRWFSDSKRFLVVGHEAGKNSRWWVCNIDTEKLTPATPEGVFGNALISPDESSVLAQALDRTWSVYPLNGGVAKAFPALAPGQGNPIQWASDGKSLFVLKGDQLPAEIYRLDIATGQRTVWKEITPPDVAGIAGQIGAQITPDGKSYVYTYRRALSDLYLVPGLK